MDKIKVGIATDNYKVKIFKKELTKKEYEYTTGDGITPDTKMFYIEFEIGKLHELQEAIKEINLKARNEKMN